MLRRAGVLVRTEADVHAAIAAGARTLLVRKGTTIMLTRPLGTSGLCFGWL